MRSIVGDPFGFAPSDIPQAEADALIAFYDATGGDDWTTNTGWKTDTTVGNWYGVTVADGHVTELDLNGDANIAGDCTDLVALTSLTILYLYDTSVSGDISGFDALASLERLRSDNTSVSGDISGFGTLTSLIYLHLNNTSVSGDISEFDTLTNLIYLHLGNSFVSGDISGLSVLTDLTGLNMPNTSVSGDISSFDTLTSLEQLALTNTPVSGDVSGFDTLTLLEWLHLSNTTSVSGDAGFVASLPNLTGTNTWQGLNLDNTSISDYTSTGNLPAWTCYVNVSDLGWTESEVDAFLSDLDGGGGTDGILDISGSNAAPSSTGIACRDSLVDKGWDVTVTT